MSNTLSRELETVLQLDNWGLVAPDITVLGFEFAQSELQQLQESVPTDVFSLENNTSILQLLTKPNDITVYTDVSLYCTTLDLLYLLMLLFFLCIIYLMFFILFPVLVRLVVLWCGKLFIFHPTLYILLVYHTTSRVDCVYCDAVM